ncbi:Card1-like endonuclease domain-containing protein [Conservatibacter flavescens]|uniref:Card1-like endonuclease domain-containing protein n=1 Tax=Conservatibacter flavescens TaxID=28161 RepID=UPI003C2E8C4E
MDRKHRDLVGGTWLEEYTYKQLKDINSIQDIALSCNVASHKYRLDKNQYSDENKGNINEFDILFLAKNKLHIIECKTQILDKSNGIKAEDILYKLETLKDYGGLMTKKCLISYFPLPEAMRNRAKTYNICLIEGTDIQRIKQKIQEWIAK